MLPECLGRPLGQREGNTMPRRSTPTTLIPLVALSVQVFAQADARGQCFDWAQRPTTFQPGLPGDFAMAFDGRACLLFGMNTFPVVSQTWLWGGTGWTQCVMDVQPSARVRHAMAYDSARGVVVLFGGFLS